jgi:hypothetical protein
MAVPLSRMGLVEPQFHDLIMRGWVGQGVSQGLNLVAAAVREHGCGWSSQANG